MNNKLDIDEFLLKFSKVILLQEKNLKYIESIEVDPTLVQDYRKVIAYLKGRTNDEIANILGTKQGRRKQNLEHLPTYSDEELLCMDSNKIKTILSSADVSRSLLERLASRRFGVTKGALSMLGSRDALKDKLFTLLGHESTHAAIARAVTDNQQHDPDKPKLP